MAKKENKEIKKAVETLDRISMDPEERERYESIAMAEFFQRISNQKFLDKGKAEGRAEGLTEGKAKGKIEGEKQKSLEIAKKLLEKHIDVETIKETTGVSDEDIDKLKKL